MGSPTYTSSAHSTSESFAALQATVKILFIILLAGICAAADAGAGEAALKPVDLQQADFDTAMQASSLASCKICCSLTTTLVQRDASALIVCWPTLCMTNLQSGRGVCAPNGAAAVNAWTC